MSKVRQTIVEQLIPLQGKTYGERKQANLNAAFSHFNDYLGTGQFDLTKDLQHHKMFQLLVQTGRVTGNGVIDYSRDFEGGPNGDERPVMADVETGGEGLPASPFVPNLASPGPGSVNASTQPEYKGDIPLASSRNQFGSGLGGTADTAATDLIKKTSEGIASQSALDLEPNRSFDGSGGS